MTINIRGGVFETNSSSSHSFSLHFPGSSVEISETIVPNEKGQIVLTGGNYTRSEFSISKPLDKANVIAANIIVFDNKDLKDRFEKIMKEHTGATEIIYDIRLVATNGQPPNTFYCPRLDSAYSYYYDEEKDEEIESYFEDIIKDEKLLKIFLFSNRAYFEVGIREC